jgi:hypothetical protein
MSAQHSAIEPHVDGTSTLFENCLLSATLWYVRILNELEGRSHPVAANLLRVY